jgi:hypothetical protein
MASKDAAMSELLDAYGNPFDPRPFVARWRKGDRDEAAGTLWVCFGVQVVPT